MWAQISFEMNCESKRKSRDADAEIGPGGGSVSDDVRLPAAKRAKNERWVMQQEVEDKSRDCQLTVSQGLLQLLPDLGLLMWLFSLCYCALLCTVRLPSFMIS